DWRDWRDWRDFWQKLASRSRCSVTILQFILKAQITEQLGNSYTYIFLTFSIVDTNNIVPFER
ncbi:MAG: hypothetical protein P1U56_21035, partial [Saprospiraceae bacterium]|nr:hypothetical protein [Saprospiraceae bacterium]